MSYIDCVGRELVFLPGKAQMSEYSKLYNSANDAGRAAAEKRVPTAMVVSEHASPLDDSSPVAKQWLVPEGVCGFAWINIKPGNSPFANWLKKEKLARKAYAGGVEIWVSAYGQSMERKEAYANAFATVLSFAGIKAYAGSRMD